MHRRVLRDQPLLVAITDIVSSTGRTRLDTEPHVNAPVADFPVRKIIGAHHFVADLTLPYGRVRHDDNKS